jgi:hypothetical protein
MDLDPALRSLMTDLGAQMGLSDLALDDQGSVALRFDDSLVVNLQAVADGDLLLFYADLGPPAAGEQIYPALLRGNLFWRATLGATLSLTGDEPPNVVLAQETRWRGQDLGGMVAFLERFLHTAEDWLEVVHDGGDAGLEPPSLTASDHVIGLRV